MMRISALALLAGCAASPTPAPLAVPPPSVMAPAIPVPPIPPSTSGTEAAAEYKAVEKKEIPAINKSIADGTATPESIERIHKADLAARRAVRMLVAQDGHPSDAAKRELRKAMEELIKATEAR